MRRNIIISVIISIAFLAFGAVFWQSYLRFGEACRDLGLSVAYYFCELFGVEYAFTPTVTEYSAVMQWDFLLPSDFAGFTDAAGRYFSLLFSGGNFAGYWGSIANGLEGTAKILIIALPCVILLVIIVRAVYRRPNTKHNHDTLPLRVFKWLARRTYQPIKRAIKSYLVFLKRHLWIVVCWALLWAFHLNLASVVIGFFAYYFYFVLSFNVANLYVQVCKVMQDEDLLICGYQPGEDGKIKDLILGYFDEEGKLRCRGKVYLGISGEERRIIEAFAKNNRVSKPWFAKYKNAVWLKPELVGTAHFMHETQSGTMRQPVWKGLRDDK